MPRRGERESVSSKEYAQISLKVWRGSDEGEMAGDTERSRAGKFRMSPLFLRLATIFFCPIRIQREVTLSYFETH